MWVWGVLVVWTLLSLVYGRAWRSELTLWSYAAPLAPTKPRPHLHLALALLEVQRFDEARAVVEYVARLNLAGRPPWDQQETREAVNHLRLVISRLDPVFP